MVSGFLLVFYFVVGVVLLLLWVKLVGCFGWVCVWFGVIGLFIVVFVGVSLFGSGDFWVFVVICIVFGLVFGVDLVLLVVIVVDFGEC